MAGVLQTYLPFLAANWQLVLMALLAAAVLHLLLERCRTASIPVPAPPAAVAAAAAAATITTAATAATPWRDEVAPEDDDLTPPPDVLLPRVPFSMESISPEEMVRRSEQFYKQMNGRRSVRAFSRAPVPRQAVESAIRAAGTAPSGAHTEPWTFVLVESPEVKAAVRRIVEDEEEVNYRKRMGQKWVDDLAPLGTTWLKEYLTDAPFLILVFRHAYGVDEQGQRFTTYYNEISCNLACGVLLAALHQAGLATLTSTPLNCGPRLRQLLERPANEKLVLLLPVGRPADDCTVPDLTRRPLERIMVVL
ncbi:iodotyrosine deiodinase 1-like [Pollicipes pollicipes]|uniref:iodotyrosine deiodinase 1-like n=1 Tax=Pollicipes pollicipes TaxID=41117 RepID=UPI001884DC3F|nr:iodotyrosine deiodinase 1-like [Pollicipes pollicipes]